MALGLTRTTTSTDFRSPLGFPREPICSKHGRSTFTKDGRLVTGDVGQSLWEEVTFVPKGGNLGWNIREGDDCFRSHKPCSDANLVAPVYTYGRREGKSITGGVIYWGTSLKSLRGKYIFGDFVSGRLWAMDLPAPGHSKLSQPILALGRWAISPSCFARNASGEVLVADYGGGTLYELVSP